MSEATTAPASAPSEGSAAPTEGSPAPVQSAPEVTSANSVAPAAEPTSIPADAEAGDKGTFNYAPTGDSKLDMTLAFVGKHGFGPGHPAMVAAVNGDFSLLKAQLAEKGVAGADAYIALGEASYQNMHAENEKRRAADKAAVENAVGGAEEWAAIQEWAGKNASEEERGPLRELLGKGGQHAIIAARFLASQYQLTNGPSETKGSGAPVSELRGAPVGTSDALSPKDYAAAVHEARIAHRGNTAFESSAEYAKLRERRMRFNG